jgi:hypothetical protein
MTAGEIWTLLARVGLGPAGGSFDALTDPAATDALAAALADRLQAIQPDLVVVWEGLNSAILGYAVGRRLGVPVAVLTDDEGLVTTATPARRGRRAVLVAALTPDASIARMAGGYLANQGTALMATATLLGRPSEPNAVTLADLPPAEAPGDLQRPDASPSPSSTLWQPPRPSGR